MDAFIETTKGQQRRSALQRQLIFEERPDQYVVSVRYFLAGELVRAEAYPAPLDEVDADGRTVTTIGLIQINTLDRHLIFTEGPQDYSIAIEYRAQGELVKRSAHVICKEPCVVAGALAASVG